MIKKVVKFLLLFFVICLSILFGSAFSSVFGPVLALVLMIGYNFFEGADHFFGIFLAFMGGMAMDIYSSVHFLGLYAVSACFLSIVMKLLIDRYVRVF